MYPGYFFFNGPRENNKVALTFDDGPDDEATPQILNILKETSVKGTFFIIGKNAQMHPDSLRRIVAEGHTIANHTWSHPNMLRLNPGRARQEVEKNQELLERITGLKTALVRLPWGAVSKDVMNLAQEDGYRVIGWSADSFDWREPRAAQVLASLDAQISPGAIILMHSVVFPDTNGVTVKVLPALIKKLKAQGYQFVTVDELLHIPAYQQPENLKTAGSRPESARTKSPFREFVEFIKTVTNKGMYAFISYCQEHLHSSAGTRARKILSLRQFWQYFKTKAHVLDNNIAKESETLSFLNAHPIKS